MACAPVFLSAGAMLVSADDGGVNHHVFIVVIAGQELENPLESTTLGPSVEALIDDLPVAKARGRIAPREAGAKPEQNGFDEQTIVRRRAAHMAFGAWQNVFDPIPSVVAQGLSPHRSAPPQADHSRVRHLLIQESLAIRNTKGSASDSDPFSPQLNGASDGVQKINVSTRLNLKTVIPKAPPARLTGDSQGGRFLTPLARGDSRHAISGQIARGLFGPGASDVGSAVEDGKPEPSSSVAGRGSGRDGPGGGGEDRRHGSADAA